MSDSMPEFQDQGLSEGTITDNSNEVNTTSEETINPIWADALKNIPTEFHNQLTPTFKDWDTKFEAERSKINTYKPYEALIQNNVPFEHVDQAMQLADLFKSSPRDVYDYLQKQYNYGTPTPVVEAEPENFDLAAEGQYNPEKDPRFIQLQQQVAFNEQRYQQAEQQRVTTEMNTQVTNEVAQVTQAFPMLDMADVANMALGLSQNSGKLPNLMEAAQQMAKYLPVVRASDGAPPSISGNRGLPTTPIDFGKMTSDERSKFVADAMRASNSD